MKILYVTDLHGITWRYERIFEEAINQEVDMVINGGDMLPHMTNLMEQDKYIMDFLDEYLSKFNNEKIYYLSYLGNDDLIIFDKLFDDICNKYPYIVHLAQCRFKLDPYEFIGMNWVVDYPFRLKDRARKDHEDYIFQKQFGKAILSKPEGYEIVGDWFSYSGTLPTIKEALEALPRPDKMKNAIYVIHMPPALLGLDVCGHGDKVGSESLYHFLKENQPLLSLHGHIHESPECSGSWSVPLGKTYCLQPGQSKFHKKTLVYALIELDPLKFERIIVKKDA